MLAMRRESEQYTIYSSNNNNNQSNINLNINSSEISENNNNNNNTSTNTNNSVSGGSNVNGVNGSSASASSIVTSGLHQNQFYSSPFNFNGYASTPYPSLGAFTGKKYKLFFSSFYRIIRNKCPSSTSLCKYRRVRRIRRYHTSATIIVRKFVTIIW